MSARRPSLDQALIAIQRYPVDPATDAELAEALQLTAEVHIPRHSNADRAGHYGACRCCGQMWPCPSWRAAEQAAREWVWAAAQLVIVRARAPRPRQVIAA